MNTVRGTGRKETWCEYVRAMRRRRSENTRVTAASAAARGGSAVTQQRVRVNARPCGTIHDRRRTAAGVFIRCRCSLGCSKPPRLPLAHRASVFQDSEHAQTQTVVPPPCHCCCAAVHTSGVTTGVRRSKAGVAACQACAGQWACIPGDTTHRSNQILWDVVNPPGEREARYVHGPVGG